MPTTITEHVDINATPDQVWAVLADLARLADYDPVVVKSTVVGERADGVGARRRCDAKQGRFFVEEVIVWEPTSRLAFAIVECNLPTSDLTHRYTLDPSGVGTRVTEVMTYSMKFGPLGRLLNAVMLRRKTTESIVGFLAGLKRTVEV